MNVFFPTDTGVLHKAPVEALEALQNPYREKALQSPYREGSFQCPYTEGPLPCHFGLHKACPDCRLCKYPPDCGLAKPLYWGRTTKLLFGRVFAKSQGLHMHIDVHISVFLPTGMGVLHKAPIERGLCKAPQQINRRGLAKCLHASQCSYYTGSFSRLQGLHEAPIQRGFQKPSCRGWEVKTWAIWSILHLWHRNFHKISTSQKVQERWFFL